MGILNTLFALLLLSFPFGTLLRIGVMPDVFVYPMDIILAVLFILTVYKLALKFPHFHGVHKAFAVFIVIGFLSLIINSYWLSFREFNISLLYLLRLILYMNLAVVFVVFKKEITARLSWMFAIGMFFVILGFIQYVFYPDLRPWYILGWDDHLFRMFSTVLDPNFAGALFVLHFIMSLYLSIHTKTRMRYVFIASCLFTGIAIFLTYSRTAYMMLIVSTPFVLLTMNKVKYIALFIVCMIIGLVILPKDLRSEGVDLLRTSSIEARLTSYSHALTIFSDSPLIGVGFNSYKYAQQDRNLISRSPHYESHSDAGVPNSFLFVLATTGILGFISFLTIIWNILKLWRNNKQRIEYSILFSSTIAILVGSLFDNVFFYPFVMLWFFFLVGYCLSRETTEKT